jgi:bacterioferritin (cytochrome b1)
VLTEDELWLLSFYRTSEISGALFFGSLAKLLRPSAIQMDMTRHFADEAQHARYWTDCIAELDASPLKLRESYQDAYLEAAGLPVNVMEILSITHAFERRVANQYAKHAKVAAAIHPTVAATVGRIIADERWHLEWVRQALHDLEPKYGVERVRRTMARHVEADQVVYAELILEQEGRAAALGLLERETT